MNRNVFIHNARLGVIAYAAITLSLVPSAFAVKSAALNAGEVNVLTQRIDRLEIDHVPGSFPVGFCLLTHGDRQYAAYFSADHQMTVASRTLDSDVWSYAKLPSKIMWDSHNYITMKMDRDGFLHLAGNMHSVKLVYFRTEKPTDITTFKRFAMTGQDENRVTYPKFMNDHEGNLIFDYRNGRSGSGIRIYNRYDRKTRTWSRLLDTPLLDGLGKCNAYPTGPVRGPDGLFHLIWVWRDTPDCATNHDLSYARSKDMIHWETASGERILLPMKLTNRSLIVDPIPSGGGTINGGQKLTFDTAKRPIITYHKNDDDGNMQVYATRVEEGKWVRRQLTSWDKLVPFAGMGAMEFIGIRITALESVEPGVLTTTYHHKDYGRGRLFVDEQTLRPIDRTITIPDEFPAELNQVKSDFIGENAKGAKGMAIRRAMDSGDSEDDDVRYILQWETLGPNRDRKPPRLAPNSRLELIELRKGSSEVNVDAEETKQD